MKTQTLVPGGSIQAVDTGHALALLDVRSGGHMALIGPAREFWRGLSTHAGDCAAAAQEAGVSAADADTLVEYFITNGMASPCSTPCVWPQVTVLPPPPPSWGTEEILARFDRPPHVALGWRVLAVGALGVTLAVGAAGRRPHAFGRILRLARLAGAMPFRARLGTAEKALWAVRHAARYLPVRVACLEETTAAVVVLAFIGHRATWCHGIAPDPLRLHAWLMAEGEPVDPPSWLRRYTPITFIPASGNDTIGDCE